MSAIDKVIGRHQKIALQFSGGKDSMAVLHLLRDYWDRLTVYYLDSGDAFPEVLEVVAEAEAMVPNFMRIPGRVNHVTEQHGFPSDVVPCGSTWMGRMAGDRDVPMLSRYECCWLSIQQPMQERMVADGITLLIRGQKNADRHKGPYRSGDIAAGFEFFYPVEDWTDEDVLLYLKDLGVKLPRFYDYGVSTGPECKKCSAWWDKRVSAYMLEFHPEEHAIRQARQKLILDAIVASTDSLIEEDQ